MKKSGRPKIKKEIGSKIDVFVSKADLEWMRHYRLPRTERLRIKAGGKAG